LTKFAYLASPFIDMHEKDNTRKAGPYLSIA